MTPIATTARLCLRPYETKDIEPLATLLNDANVVRWMSFIPFPYTVAMAQDWYESCAADYRQNTAAFWAIADRQTDAFLGGIGLHKPNTCVNEPGILEIGYWLGAPFWGRGYMTEAVLALVSFGFQTISTLPKIVSSTQIDNKGSQQVLRKAGFSCEGLFTPEQRGFRGGAQSIRWSLKRADYDKASLSQTEASFS